MRTVSTTSYGDVDRGRRSPRRRRRGRAASPRARRAAEQAPHGLAPASTNSAGPDDPRRRGDRHCGPSPSEAADEQPRRPARSAGTAADGGRRPRAPPPSTTAARLTARATSSGAARSSAMCTVVARAARRDPPAVEPAVDELRRPERAAVGRADHDVVVALAEDQPAAVRAPVDRDRAAEPVASTSRWRSVAAVGAPAAGAAASAARARRGRPAARSRDSLSVVTRCVPASRCSAASSHGVGVDGVAGQQRRRRVPRTRTGIGCAVDAGRGRRGTRCRTSAGTAVRADVAELGDRRRQPHGLAVAAVEVVRRRRSP